MKKLCPFVCFFIGVLGYAQTIPGSFKIINNQRPEQESFYTSSIEQANMESYRLKETETTLHFDNGFDCVFFSAKDLFLKGKKINPTTYQESFPGNFTLPVFNVLISGKLVAIYKPQGKFK